MQKFRGIFSNTTCRTLYTFISNFSDAPTTAETNLEIVTTPQTKTVSYLRIHQNSIHFQIQKMSLRRASQRPQLCHRIHHLVLLGIDNFCNNLTEKIKRCFSRRVVITCSVTAVVVLALLISAFIIHQGRHGRTPHQPPDELEALNQIRYYWKIAVGYTFHHVPQAFCSFVWSFNNLFFVLPQQ